MLNITSFQPVTWPALPATGVSATPASAAVEPVKSTSRDPQTGLGQGQERARTEGPRRASGDVAAEGAPVEAAPLLPRKAPDPPQGGAEEDLKAEQARTEQEQAADQAEENARKLQLQDVLSNVWKASAAVVELALNRETGAVDPAAEDPSTASAPELGAVRQAPPQPETLGPNAVRAAPHEWLPAWAKPEVVAYDAQGHSSRAPLEAGSLIDHRV